MEFKSFEVMEGTTKEANYLVVAKHNGLRVGVRPLLFPFPQGEEPVLMIAMRVRAEPIDSDSTAFEAASTFKLPFEAKGAHASLVAGTSLISLPCSMGDAYSVWTENKVTAQIVDQLFDRLGAVGAEFIVKPEQVIDFLNLFYDTVLIFKPVTKPTEFKLDFSLAAEAKSE